MLGAQVRLLLYRTPQVIWIKHGFCLSADTDFAIKRVAKFLWYIFIRFSSYIFFILKYAEFKLTVN
jgi:hypothetical protein